MLGNNLKTYDTIIVGAGIVGAACAAELQQRGQSVLVIDSQSPGTGATAACMGHIVVMDDSPSMLDFSNYSRQLWSKLVPELPENCEDVMCGTMWIAEDDDELEEACKKKKLYEAAGVESELLSSSELAKYEPNLKSGLAGALRVKDDRVVYPTNVVRYLLRNVEVLSNTQVVYVSENEVKTASGSSYHAGKVVVSAGVLTKKLLGLPLIPKKGHLLITERYPNFANHQIIELGYVKKAHSAKGDSCAFNIQPRKTGQMIIGSSREFCGFDKSINKKLLSEMLHRANYFMPDLKNLKALRVWAGLRPASEDGVPFIGFLKKKKVYVCAGHEGLGITTSLASAKLIAAQIFGEKPEIDARPYDPERLYQESANHEH